MTLGLNRNLNNQISSPGAPKKQDSQNWLAALQKIELMESPHGCGVTLTREILAGILIGLLSLRTLMLLDAQQQVPAYSHDTWVDEMGKTARQMRGYPCEP